MQQESLIVGLGETLWDVFPDGPKLGGAPLNYACSASELAGSKANVALVSAVGSDELGRNAVQAVRQHGVDNSYVQTIDKPTGQVLIELDSDGVASYEFVSDTAWDALRWNPGLQQLATRTSAVCFGTLGQRSSQSRATIRKFVAATSSDTLRVLDVNLRPPHYDNQVILESLELANLLKLNDDELPILAELCGAQGNDVEVSRQLAERYQLRYVAVTRGAGGGLLVSSDAVSDQPGVPVEVADTVGAGDAFTAALTLGLLAGHDLDRVNQNAVTVASFVCSQSGATVKFPQPLMQAVMGAD